MTPGHAVALEGKHLHTRVTNMGIVQFRCTPGAYACVPTSDRNYPGAVRGRGLTGWGCNRFLGVGWVAMASLDWYSSRQRHPGKTVVGRVPVYSSRHVITRLITLTVGTDTRMLLLVHIPRLGIHTTGVTLRVIKYQLKLSHGLLP
jgi:hypothetical protein